MLGMSAAVIQGLHEMRRPPEEIKIVEMTEAEIKIHIESQLKLRYLNSIDAMIMLQVLKAGADVDIGSGRRLRMKVDG
jgi:predicted nucleic acid-binding protein